MTNANNGGNSGGGNGGNNGGGEPQIEKTFENLHGDTWIEIQGKDESITYSDDVKKEVGGDDEGVEGNDEGVEGNGKK